MITSLKSQMSQGIWLRQQRLSCPPLHVKTWVIPYVICFAILCMAFCTIQSSSNKTTAEIISRLSLCYRLNRS